MSETFPLFSVIIPTYNAQLTISVCLDSIINQDYTNVEIIIIDGLSTDETINIAKEKYTYFKNITWLSEPDRGIYDAMNKGIKLAKGDWLYFLGSDDFLIDHLVLSDIANVFKSEELDLIHGEAVFASKVIREGGPRTLDELFTIGNMCHQTIFYHKNLFETVGDYNTDYPIVADWDFNIRCFSKKGIHIRYINRTIAFFNDLTGVSSISKKDPFYRMIPAPFIWDLNVVNQEKRDLLNSNEYKLGSKLYSFLRKIKVIGFLKFVLKS